MAPPLYDDVDEALESDGYREPDPPPSGNGFLVLAAIFFAAAVLTNIIAWALGL